MLIANDKRKIIRREKGFAIWLTGLSGSGKSTIAEFLGRTFDIHNMSAFVLDGDKLRAGINRDLDFTPEGRRENIRRAGEMCKMLIEGGVIVIASLITPVEKDRKWLRMLLGIDLFLVFIDCPLEICERRDPKGLYRSAREGKIKHFTGITSAYETPVHPDLVLETHLECPSDCISKLWNALEIHFSALQIAAE
jgi:adenylylsulfate kinase